MALSQTKHTVEFSNNTHTPTTTNHQGQSSSGVTATSPRQLLQRSRPVPPSQNQAEPATPRSRNPRKGNFSKLAEPAHPVKTRPDQPHLARSNRHNQNPNPRKGPNPARSGPNKVTQPPTQHQTPSTNHQNTHQGQRRTSGRGGATPRQKACLRASRVRPAGASYRGKQSRNSQHGRAGEGR